jgi:hypothetical protein
MPRPLAVDEAAAEFQARVRELRRRDATPLWLAALASGDWCQMADAQALAGALRAAESIARRMAGHVKGRCADGLLAPGHGRAA